MNTRRLLASTLTAATLLTGFQIVRAEAQVDGTIQQGNGNQQGKGYFDGNLKSGGRQQQRQQQNGALQGGRALSTVLNSPVGARMRRLNASDPSRSAVNYLLTRNDVRSELGISTRQREALDAANQKAPQEMVERLRNNPALQEMAERTRRMRELPQGERQAQRERLRQEMRQSTEQLMTELNAHQSELDKRAEEILTPAQIKRLYELDLQFRGGLALAEAKIGQELDLTAEQHQKVQEYIEEFRTKQRELMSEAMGMGERTIRPNGPVNQTNANGGNTAPNRNGVGRNRQTQSGGASQNNPAQASRTVQMPNPQEMQTRLDNAQAELDKLRKTLGAKALALFNSEQTAYWKEKCGRTFTFRVVD